MPTLKQLALEQICERRQLEDEMIHQVVVPLLQQTSGTVYTLLGERVIEGSARSFSGFSGVRALFSWLCGEAY